MSRTGLKALCCGAAVALMSAAAAQAAESAAGKPTSLEEVVVTAERTATNLQLTPIAVTALSGEVLRDRNVASLLDITNYVPSLSIGSRSGTSSANGGVSIRGMGVDATASSAAVGIYVDEQGKVAVGGKRERKVQRSEIHPLIVGRVKRIV